MTVSVPKKRKCVYSNHVATVELWWTIGIEPELRQARQHLFINDFKLDTCQMGSETPMRSDAKRDMRVIFGA